jgi:hypothetical protein
MTTLRIPLNTTCTVPGHPYSLSFWSMAQSSGDDPRSRVTDSDARNAGPLARGAARGRPAARPQPRLPGYRPGRLGVAIVVAGTATGALLTVLTGSEPGLALGICLILATVLGAFIVSPRAAYAVIPVPALAYTAAALVTGYIHDRAVDHSTTALAVGAVQWIASGFFVMSAATVIAIGIAAGRRVFSGRGSRRAWRDLPAGRPLGSRRYRGAHGLAPAAGQEREAEYPAPGSLPAGPRHSG